VRVADRFLVTAIQQVVLDDHRFEVPGVDQLEQVFRSVMEREGQVPDERRQVLAVLSSTGFFVDTNGRSCPANQPGF